jgi:hypothetical protein
MSQLTKAQLCAIIVERSVFYGSRTVKTLNRWWNKNHCEIVGHNKRAERIAVGKAVSNLVKYRDGRVKKLMRLPRKDLEVMLSHMSDKVLEQRYGGGNRVKEKNLPPIDLGKHSRKVILDKKDIAQWMKDSKKRARKMEPVIAKTVEKPKPQKRRKQTAMSYVKNIMRFNENMATTYNVAGLEG